MAKRKTILLTSVAQVIEKLGGLTACARLFGYASSSGPANWHKRRIPAEFHWLIERRLSRLGYAVDPSVFDYRPSLLKAEKEAA